MRYNNMDTNELKDLISSDESRTLEMKKSTGDTNPELTSMMYKAPSHKK